MRIFALLFLSYFFYGCAGGAYKHDPCIITPPKEINYQEEQAYKIGVDLTAFIKAPVKTNLETEFKNKVNVILQSISDKDLSCQMILQTIVCLGNRPENHSAVTNLTAYIREQDKCGNRSIKEAAMPSFDNGAKLTLVGEDLVATFDKNTNTLSIKVPISPDQIAKYNSDVSGIRLYESHAVVLDNKWQLVGKNKGDMEEHKIASSKRNGNYIEATLKYDGQLKHSTHAWFRLWGANPYAKDKGGEWLWIVNNSYKRMDKNDNPSYEFIVDINTGEVQPVPANFKDRK